MWLGGDLTNGHANGCYKAATERRPLVLVLQKRADLYIWRGRTEPSSAPQLWLSGLAKVKNLPDPDQDKEQVWMLITFL